MSTNNKAKHAAISFLVAVICMIGFSPVNAATSARHGTVVAVQPGAQSASQRSFSEPGYNTGYQERSHARAAIGGVLGGVLGATLGRNSNSGRYLGGAGGAAIGTAIGYNLDRRADVRLGQREVIRQATARQGAQIVVELDGGETIAVFSRDVRGMYPGAKVWLIGGDELIPAN